MKSDDQAYIFMAELDTNYYKHKVLLFLRKNYYGQ